MLKHVLLLFVLIGCHQDIDPRAVAKNNAAVELVKYELLGVRDEVTFLRAISLLDTAIQIDSSYRLAYVNKAQFLCKIGKQKEAIRTIEVLNAREPNSPSGFLLLGMIFDQIGDTASANRNYLFTIQFYQNKMLNGERLTISQRLDIAYTRLFLDKPAAIDELEGILTENPDLPNADIHRESFRSFDRKTYIESLK